MIILCLKDMLSALSIRIKLVQSKIQKRSAFHSSAVGFYEKKSNRGGYYSLHLPFLITEKEILCGLTDHLADFSLTAEEWDQEVEESLAKAIIKNISSAKADVPLRLIIRELDIILQRVLS